MLSHPAVPYLDEGVNYETFFAAFGIDAAFIHMENDVAGDTYDRYFASNSANCSMWTPSAPTGDGWLLLEIYDTEDGPVALYVREKKPESMRERWKREKRESDAAAPSPADERAAFEHNVPLHELWADAAALCHRVQQGSLSPDDLAAHIRKKIDAVIGQARAASANETVAEGAKPIGSVITVWGDGSWKSWSAGDAAYAASDPNWLVNIAAPQPAQADARVGLTDEQREAIDFVIGWYEQSTIADNPYREHIAALRALLAAHPGQPEPRAEATDDRQDKAKGPIKTLSDIIHDQAVAMQAAIIEWQHGKGAEAGLSWIVNTLSGTGHLPDFDAPHGKHAQFWFNANQANPLPTCFCGNPSSSLWMGQGFCCDEHYREAKVKHDAAHAGDAS